MIITIDMRRARALRREQLRAERAPLLAELDIAYLRAIEAADLPEQQRIAAEKARLRDITQDPRLDAAQTPADLLAVSVQG